MGLLDIFKMDNDWKGKAFVRDRGLGGGPRRRPKIDPLLGGRYSVIRTPGGREVPHQEVRDRYKNRNQDRVGGPTPPPLPPPPPPPPPPGFPPRQGGFGGPRNVYDPLPPRRDPPPQDRDLPDQQDEEAGCGEDEAGDQSEDEAEDENELEVADHADRSHRTAASNATTGRHGRRMGGDHQGPAPRPYFAPPSYWDPPRGGGGPRYMRDPLGGAPRAHWGPPPPYRAGGMGGGPDYMEPPIGLPMGGGRRLGGGGSIRGRRY